ncbi:MAG: diaminopimelate epimerase, partial [Comamonadaceae bacterium CG_4_9_14_3_um_filter_60_33]
MRIPFTKMQGAGNDFVVLDETRNRFGLGAAQYRFLADRHFGVGADQILTVRPSPAPGIDFEYLIHNADGAEVEQCGNGARCFARFVRDAGLTQKDAIRVQTKGGVIEPVLTRDGRVIVNMGAPVFDLARVPFTPGLVPAESCGPWQQWPLLLATPGQKTVVRVAVVSIGNPHAVQLVMDADTAPVLQQGPLIENHPFFP